MIGETIGNFRVTAKIGAGGMGEVFLAEQTSIGTKVAIKVLRSEISVDRQHVDRFFNEARAVSRIKHAGTVKIFDVGFHNGHAYLVMEFLEGETLSARIQRVHRLPLGQISDIGRQTAGVLEATHAAGITHRDLKPDNIYLVPDAELASQERVKILDFGIAKLTGTISGGGQKTHGTMGTPAYMAPEQWGDASKVDWRADIYSLGCVAFEMATGRPPFISTNFAEACGKHLGEAPPKLRTVLPAAPEGLETVIDAMLAKSPYGRPPLRDIAKTFEQLGVGLPLGHDETLPPRPRASASQAVQGDAPTHPAIVHSPTPLEPVPANAPTVASSSGIPKQTTLSSSSGSAPSPSTEPRKSRAPLYAVGGLVVVGGGIAAIAAATSRGPSATPPIDAAAPPADTVVTRPIDPPSKPKSIVDTVKPEFVRIGFLDVMPKQVTRDQYAQYVRAVARISGEPATVRLQALKDWSAFELHSPPSHPEWPMSWVTFEQATEFCKAIDARLQTQQEWLATSVGSWRIGTPVDDEVVVREWTSTVSGGLATVMGGSINGASKMTDAQRADSIKNPLQKEIASGPKLDPDKVASATIGIRCVRDAKCDDKAVAAAEQRADEAFSTGDFAAALAGLESALPCKPSLAKNTYLAACRAKRFPRAKQLFEQLGKPQNLAQICMKEGFDPRVNAASPPPGPQPIDHNTVMMRLKTLEGEYRRYKDKHGDALSDERAELITYMQQDNPPAEQLKRIEEFRAKLKPKD